MIHDPGRNKFFIIGWPEYEILERWALKDPELVVEAVNSQTTLQIEFSDIENVLAFLKQNYLSINNLMITLLDRFVQIEAFQKIKL